MRILILILIFATNLISNGYTRIAVDHGKITTCAVLISQALQSHIEEKLLEIATKNPSEIDAIIDQIYDGMSESDIRIQYLENLFSAVLAEKRSASAAVSPTVPVMGTVVTPIHATAASPAAPSLKVRRHDELLALFDKCLDVEFKGAESPENVKKKFDDEIAKLPIENVEDGAWAQMLAVGPNTSGSAVGKKNEEMTIAERMSTIVTNTGKLKALIEKIGQNLPK